MKYDLSYKYEKYEKSKGEIMKYKNKEYECGTAKLGERGQIVIPKAIREELGLKQGDNLILLGNKEEGIRIINANSLEELAEIVLKEKNNYSAGDEK